MKQLLIPVCMSALAAILAADFSKPAAADGRASVSADRSGASVSTGRSSVSASRSGASVSTGRSSVSASRSGASVSTGRSSVSASRSGADISGGTARSAAPGRDIADAVRSGGHVNAVGDREYDDLASWLEDMGWLDREPADKDEPTTGNSSSVEQVSKATATSTDGSPAIAKASNTEVTNQN